MLRVGGEGDPLFNDRRPFTARIISKEIVFCKFFFTFVPSILILLLLSKRYNSCRVLAFSTIFFHSWRSWACSVHLRGFIFLRSFLTSSSHLCLGLPTGRVIYGCHLDTINVLLPTDAQKIALKGALKVTLTFWHRSFTSKF